MSSLEKLEQLYAEYYRLMEQVRQEEKGLRGAMGVFVMGPKGRNDCNVQFNQAVQQLLAEPESVQQAEEIIDYVLQEGWAHRDWLTVSLMLTAVHGYLTPLLPYVSSEKKRELSAWYEKAYPKLDCTPVMKKFKKELKEAAGR